MLRLEGLLCAIAVAGTMAEGRGALTGTDSLPVGAVGGGTDGSTDD